MSFPSNPVNGTLYTNAAKITYKFTEGSWVAVSEGVSPIKYSMGYDEPVNPVVGDFWLNVTNTNLFMYIYDGGSYYWKQLDNSPVISIDPPEAPRPGIIWYNPINKTLYYYVTYNNENHWEILASLDNEDTRAILSALPLSWLYSKARMSFELFSNTSLAYKWRDIDPIKIISANAGDDTIDVVTTDGLLEGSQYIIYTDSGVIESPVVKTVLSPTKLRVVTDLSHNITESTNAFIARTSFNIAIDGHKATVKDGDILYSRPLNALEFWKEGYVVIRRNVNGLGTFKVSYRKPGDIGFVIADLEKIVLSEDGLYRDEHFYIPLTYTNTELKVEFFGTDANTIDEIVHMILYCKQLSEEIIRMERPTNVSPADMETLVSTTPTLTGSPFRHLYDIAQNGAEFQIATDKNFSNLILNTSTAYMASWVKISGQSTNFSSGVNLSDRKFILVGNNGAVKITANGGGTFTDGTLGVSTDLNDISFNKKTGSDAKLLVVGASGLIRTSTDGGVTWNSQVAAGGYSSIFKGCAFGGFIAYAVGESGEIQRSTNNGVIWTKMTQANGFVGTFTDVCCISDGSRAIAVGANGTIQTTSNSGLNWVSRSPFAGYNGQWNRVAMTDDGFAIVVGANAEIQYSLDYGSTWTKANIDGSFSGSFLGVSIVNNIAVAVGASGEIQSSYDKGIHWVKRLPAASESGSFTTAVISENSDYFTLIVGSSGIVQKSFRLEGVAGNTYTVPEGTDLLNLNSVYWWRLRYKDNVDIWSEWSIPTVFATRETVDEPDPEVPPPIIRYIKQPSNMVPVDGSKNVDTLVTLQASMFAYEGPVDIHTSSQWQISTSKDFSSTVYDSGDVISLTSHTLPNGSILTVGSTYYWRVRYKGQEVGYSAWSTPTKFAVAKIPNSPSIIDPSDNEVNVPTITTIVSSNFVSDYVGEVHVKSQWQISKSSNFSTPNIVFDSGESNKLTSINISGGVLSPLIKYYFRVRHKGLNTGWSNWSSIINATTGGSPDAPSISSPANNSTDISRQPSIVTSAFSPTIFGETHIKSQYQISIVQNFTSISYDSGETNDLTTHTVANDTVLSWSTVYYVRARHKGSITGWSDWSSSNKFTVSFAPGEQVYSTPGIYTFTVPANVTKLSVLGISAGAPFSSVTLINQGFPWWYGKKSITSLIGGGGGACGYINNISVTPGQQITVNVGGYSSNQPNSTKFGTWLTINNATGQSGATYSGAQDNNNGGANGGNGGLGVIASTYDYWFSRRETGYFYYGGGGGAAGRPNTNGGTGSHFDTNSRQVWIEGSTSKLWSVKTTFDIGDWVYGKINVTTTWIVGSTSTSQNENSEYTEYTEVSRTYSLNGLTAAPGYCWYKARRVIYVLKLSTNPGKYETISDFIEVKPTGIKNRGCGGITIENGEGAKLDGTSGVGPYGAGAGYNRLPQNGGLRIIWGNGRTYPNNSL